MEVVYFINSDKYVIRNCELCNIDTHYAYVQEVILPDTSEEAYKNAMVHSVEQDLAWFVMKNDKFTGFLYVSREGNVFNGNAIYGTDLYSMGLVWNQLFEVVGPVCVRFKPHKGQLSKFVSIADKSSIRLFHAGIKDYIVVDIKDIEPKVRVILDSVGVHK